MKFNKIKTSTDKIIHVYDDLFSYQERKKNYNFVLNSFFRVGGGDSSLNGYNDQQVFSTYSEEDLVQMEFKKLEGFQILSKKYDFESRNIKQIRVNCTTNSERNRHHNDNEGLTFLYYANFEWDVLWGGHTLFLTEDLSDAEYTCLYKPGRVVVFDGSIPHMILTPSNLCPCVRFTLAIQYDLIKSKEL